MNLSFSNVSVNINKDYKVTYENFKKFICKDLIIVRY